MACTGCNDCECIEAKNKKDIEDKLRVLHDLVCVIANANCIDLPRILSKGFYMLWCILRDILRMQQEIDLTVFKKRDEELCRKISDLAVEVEKQLTANKENSRILNEYNTKLAIYNEAMETYNRNYKLYQDGLASFNKANKDYETAVAQYEKDKANYDKLRSDYATALAKYNTDLEAYRKVMAEYTKAVEQYNKDMASYNASNSEYARLKAEYDRKLKEYNDKLREAEKAESDYQSALTAYNQSLKDWESRQLGNINYSIEFIELENTGDTGEDYFFDKNTGEFTIKSYIYDGVKNIGAWVLKGKIGLKATINGVNNRVNVVANEVTIREIGYEKITADVAFSDFRITYKKPNGAVIYDKSYRGQSAFTQAINITYPLTGNLDIHQGQSQNIDFLFYDDFWVAGSRNKVSLKVTAPTISLEGKPQQPTKKTVVIPERPTEPVAPDGNKPVEPTRTNQTEPVRPSEPTVTEPTRPTQPTGTKPTEPTKPTKPEEPQLFEVKAISVTCGDLTPVPKELTGGK